MDIEFFITIFIVGALLLLSFLHLSNVTAVNRHANLWFGIFTFQWSTFWLDEFLLPENLSSTSPMFIIIRSFQFLIPITFALSIELYTNPRTKITSKHVWVAVVPVFFLFFLLFMPRVNADLFELCYLVIFLGHALFYTIWAYMKILKHQRAIKLFHSNTEHIDLRWIKYITYSFITSAILVTAYNVVTKAESLNVYINLYFLAVVYLVAFYSLGQKEIFPRGIELSEVLVDYDMTGREASGPKIKVLEDAEMDVLKTKLLQLMEDEKPYLNSELNLVKLAERMNLSTHQLSYLINAAFGENFFNFINKYRVRKAKELLKNPDYDHFNILVLAYEAGFNSKTSFNTTFKKMTNATPTTYRNLRD